MRGGTERLVGDTVVCVSVSVSVSVSVCDVCDVCVCV
jgi:hypothetical protein